MRTANKAIVVLLILTPFTMWAFATSKNCANGSRIRDLEGRNAKLMEEMRSASATNDAMKKKLIRIENEKAELNEQVKELLAVTRERDDLVRQLANRTNERDGLHNQLVQFSKELQGLLGRIEAAAAGHGNNPAVTTTVLSTGGKSS